MNKPTTVLLLEDEIDLMTLIKDFLNSMGISVVTANNVEDAYRSYQENKIDLIVSDLILGTGEKGTDLLAKVREQNVEVPFLLMSGFPDGNEEYTKTYNKVLFYPKPFRLHHLADTIKSFAA